MKKWRHEILNFEKTHPHRRLISARRLFNNRLRAGQNVCRVEYSQKEETITFTDQCTLPATIFKPPTKSKKHLRMNAPPYEKQETGKVVNEWFIQTIVEPLSRTPPQFTTFFDLLLEYGNIGKYNQLRTTFKTLRDLHERCRQNSDDCVKYLEHAEEISDTELETNNVHVGIFRSYIEAKKKSIQESETI